MGNKTIPTPKDRDLAVFLHPVMRLHLSSIYVYNSRWEPGGSPFKRHLPRERGVSSSLIVRMGSGVSP